MRIRDGKYILQNSIQVLEALKRKDAAVEELRERLEVIAVWADNTMDLHVPYVSGRIDVSVSAASNRQANFLDQVKRSLWCSECSTPWPCVKIDQLKSLRDFALGRGSADFKASVEKIAPKTREGQFPEVCL